MNYRTGECEKELGLHETLHEVLSKQSTEYRAERIAGKMSQNPIL